MAVVAETAADFLAVFFGCQYAGLIPCPVPYSMYVGGKDAYVQRIAGMLASARAAAIVTPDSLEEHIRLAGERRRHAPHARHSPSLARRAVQASISWPFSADEPAYIQYSSGSTSDPKGVLVTQRAISANARGDLRRMQVEPDDRAFSWLPLYHDMGLVGFCIAPMMAQASVDYLATPASPAGRACG